MKKNYTPLHCHSDYSILDSVMKVEDYTARLEQLEMSAGALTEHGNLCSSYRFYKDAKQKGIQAIIGCEMYVTPYQSVDEIRDEIAKQKKEKELAIDNGISMRRIKYYGHLVVHALNDVGYQNLLYVTNEAFQNRHYRKPLSTEEIILEHSEGLHIETACIGSLFGQDAMDGNKKALHNRIGKFKEVLGDRFSLEIQFNEIDKQHKVNHMLVTAAKEFNIPLVYAPDAHYAFPEGAELRDLTMAIGYKYFHDSEFYKSEVRRLHVKSYDEILQEWTMWEYDKEVPYQSLLDSLERTNEVASWVDFTLEHSGYKFADMQMDKTIKKQKIINAAKTGLKELVKNGEIKDGQRQEYVDRLKYELGVILERNFEDYFLVLADMITEVRKDGGMFGVARGSAGGSLLSYCLGITQLDPIKHGLIFERFLNPGRGVLTYENGKWSGTPNAPDIDVDVNSEHKLKTESYLKEKYGESKVAHILTFGTFGAKSLIRDMGRVFKLNFKMTNDLSTQFKNMEEIEPGWKRIYNSASVQLKEFMDTNKWMIPIAKKLNNNIRNAGKHAAGVIITPKDLNKEIPLYSVKGEITTGLAEGQNIRDLGELGYVKYDLLGINNLSIIRTAMILIKKHKDMDINIYKIDFTEDEVFKQFQLGNTEFIFQFGSDGMRNVLKNVLPESLNELAICNALYRPGSSAFIKDLITNKRQPGHIHYLSPLLQPILEETYGIIIYQEQVLEIFKQLGGFTLEEADNVRSVLKKTSTSGKKDQIHKDNLKKYEKIVEKFSKGCIEKGLSESQAANLLDTIKKYSRYSFNKSHSVGYAYLAYQVQWLRVHYPLYFYAALLTHNAHKPDEMRGYLQKIRNEGIELVMPNVNTAKADFSVQGDKIVCGMQMIKGASSKDIEKIVSKAPYKNLADFFEVIFVDKVTKKTVDPLIKSGACDDLLKHRVLIYEFYLHLRKFKRLTLERIKEKMKSLLEEYNGSLPPDQTEAEQMQTEAQYYGFYLNEHPMEQYALALKQLGIKTASQVTDSFGMSLPIAGLLSKLEIKKTKRNTDYAIMTLEDGQKSLVVKSWTTQPVNGIEEGSCVVAECENTKYGWTLKRNSSITIL